MLFPATVHPLIGAHRGASASAPENTLAAFDLAIEQGAELIECDVHRTADGAPVILHDFSLRRTAGQPGLVRDRTLAQLQQLDVGRWRGEQWTGERILTLDQVLDRYARRVFLNVEIKVDRRPYAGIEGQVAHAIRARGLYDRVVVSSFDEATVVRLRRADPRVRTGLLADSRPDEALLRAMETAANGVHLQAGLITAERLRRAQTRGLGVLAWTVDDPVEMSRLTELDVEAIVSNQPDRLRSTILPLRH